MGQLTRIVAQAAAAFVLAAVVAFVLDATFPGAGRRANSGGESPG
jgi:hypothetical protein